MTSISDVSRGLEPLASLDQILINQKVSLTEGISSFDTCITSR